MTTRAVLALLAIGASYSSGAVTVDPGVTEIFAGTATAQVAIKAVGGDAVTDLAAAVEVSGATITAVGYAGSIWEGAPGGFLGFFPGFPTPGSAIDPNLVLLVSGETVNANGTLLTLTIDTADLQPGDYPITLTDTTAGSSQIFTSGGQEVSATFLNGTLRVLEKPIATWREANFATDASDPGLEATVWGDLADPDGDELVNALEFAFALDPLEAAIPSTTAAAPGVPVLLAVEDGGSSYRAIRFTRKLQAPCHVVEVGRSIDLVSWDFTGNGLVELAPTSPHPNGLTEMVTVRLAAPIDSAEGRAFLQIRVDTAP